MKMYYLQSTIFSLLTSNACYIHQEFSLLTRTGFALFGMGLFAKQVCSKLSNFNLYPLFFLFLFVDAHCPRHISTKSILQTIFYFISRGTFNRHLFLYRDKECGPTSHYKRQPASSRFFLLLAFKEESPFQPFPQIRVLNDPNTLIAHSVPFNYVQA